MESMGLGLTCNGSVILDALLGVRDDDDIGGIWSPLLHGVLCRVVMVVSLVDTRLIGGGGLIGRGKVSLGCCCDYCCYCSGWHTIQSNFPHY